jgi:hypothetical protein
MVLQDSGFLGAERFGDAHALVGGEHDPAEGVVQCDVVVEGAGVLGDDVEGAAEGGEGAAVDGVGVRDAVGIWAGSVDSVVDHVGWEWSVMAIEITERLRHTCGVQKTAWATVDDFALVVHADEVRSLEHRPCDTEGVHPERVRLDRILSCVSMVFSLQGNSSITHPQCDVASHTLVEAKLREEAESQSQTALLIFALLVWVVELWWGGEVHLLCDGLVRLEAGLVGGGCRRNAIGSDHGDGVAVGGAVAGLCRCGRSHGEVCCLGTFKG